MKLKWIFAVLAVSLFISVGFYLMFNSLNRPTYKSYPDRFQVRGDSSRDEYIPKNRADSLFALEMLILQKSDQDEFNYTQGRPDIQKLLTGILSILVAIGGIGKILYDFSNSKTEKRHIEILDKFAENSEQHVELFEGIKIAADTKNRKDVTDALTNIAADHLFHKRRYITPELSEVIKSQAQRLISLSNDIMNEKFTAEMLEYSFVCIETKNKEALKQIVETFGCDFAPFYKEGQAKCVNDFKANLTKLAQSNIINSKYDRYRAYAELFLHDIIENTLIKYEEFKSASVKK